MVAHGDFVGALSPAHVLGHFEGVAIVFVSAELWTQRVFIRLCAAQNDRTRTLDKQFRREFEVFTQEVLAARERGDAARPEPPAQPGEVLSRVPLVVSDELGTAYRPTGSSAGGTGSEWRSERYGWPVEGHDHLEDETIEITVRPLSGDEQDGLARVGLIPGEYAAFARIGNMLEWAIDDGATDAAAEAAARAIRARVKCGDLIVDEDDGIVEEDES